MNITNARCEKRLMSTVEAPANGGIQRNGAGYGRSICVLTRFVIVVNKRVF